MKVLIISHNPITTYQSMGKTMLSLFSSFNKNELCQIYIYPTIPDIDVCESYFRITDRNVMTSYLHFGKVNSMCIESNQIDSNKHDLFESKEDEAFLKKKKNPLSVVSRDVMWKFSNWYDDKLKSWLNNQKPNRIFVAPGEAKFIYDIALKIAKSYNLPIVSYICDEFFFVEPTRMFGGKLQLILLKSKIRKLMTASSHLITICDELSEIYSNEFSVPATTIYTGTNYQIKESPATRKKILGITYLGNLAYNRIDSLLDVGRALQDINEECSTDYKLFLYTRTLSVEEKEKIDLYETVEYCGYVTGPDYDNVLHSADILLHIEAFDKNSIDRVKNSISTKIADSLGSGNALLAYGPKNLASIKYLINRECAFVCVHRSALKETIYDILLNEKLRNQKVEIAIKTARENHNSKINSCRLFRILEMANDHAGD